MAGDFLSRRKPESIERVLGLKALNLGQPGKRKLAWPITHRCIINHLPGCNGLLCAFA